ncbi:MAG: 2-oxoglutarate dehydrogenase E1 component [Bacteroidetes bacterium]|nr:2-oxoglutarate dehydrogenase E1 component [Bacteroidota bacterium]MBT7825062.1 2-oxoglutarate dehydrogenase E1 component [Bacteroidota bacterium]
MSNNLSFLGNASSSMIEEMYQEYLKDPNSVEQSWKKFFEGFEFARTTFHESEESNELFSKEFNVINLINAYRTRGHLFTKTNPVRKRREYKPNLSYKTFNLEDNDLETTFKAGNEIGIGPAKLSEIIDYLETAYCQSIGSEYMYIRNPRKLNWLKNKVEENKNIPHFAPHIKRHILFKLNQAVGFEQFLQKKYLGQKRFSLEGAESLIPALDAIIEKGAESGIKEFVVGMPHRGRLNILANILNKSYQDIFSEFEGKDFEDNLALGDVKYHLGYSADVVTRKGKLVHMSLSPNPSHLEAVNPVVEGIVRAKIDHRYQGNHQHIAPILIHGDAAIAGQGVVYEVVQMSKLLGYRTGGTIHIVINNQVGFTTDYLDGRSSTYCTDVAKTTLSPVFHVNGDDPEALIHTIEMAMEYRQEFKNDVYIDLLCYRRHGHNESDEPRFTQPLLYKAISKHPDPRSIYAKKLIQEGVITEDEFAKMKLQLEEMLLDRLMEARKKGLSYITPIFQTAWQELREAKQEDFEESPPTGVDISLLKSIGNKITTLPADVKFFNKSERLLARRKELIEEGSKLDWAICEHLAYASLLAEGIPIRFSGQDVERGTFSHRHAVIRVENSMDTFTPLNHISDQQARFDIYNSPLNEFAVLGYEYGYAMVNPNYLTIWEAQFGDFGNGAQIIIDQFISSAEEKWRVMNGLVLLLPHGYEGQGPEHSSARLERFLNLCGNNNMQIANCSTPANFFHIIRRQQKREFRKPLIIFTPKSLLRHPVCVSSLDELQNGKFQEIIDVQNPSPDKVEKVIICSGKIYYDLIDEREKRKAKNTAIVRMEQLYPIAKTQLADLKNKYKSVNKWLWVQEEPINMGPWPFICRKLPEFNFHVVARMESGSPAGGLAKNHWTRHQKIMDETFSY